MYALGLPSQTYSVCHVCSTVSSPAPAIVLVIILTGLHVFIYIIPIMAGLKPFSSQTFFCSCKNTYMYITRGIRHVSIQTGCEGDSNDDNQSAHNVGLLLFFLDSCLITNQHKPRRAAYCIPHGPPPQLFVFKIATNLSTSVFSYFT